MPQITNWTIANSGGSTYRAAVNTALSAIQSSSSGTAAPSPTVAGMLWYDTTNSILKRRNTANTAWVDVSADTVAATTVRGNSAGSAAAETSVSMASLRTMLGFSQSLSGSGYVVFPGGAICQWGSAAGTTNSVGSLAITYPLTFPTAAYRPIVCNGDFAAAISNLGVVVGSTATTGFSISSGTPSTSIRVNFIVWGI